MLLTPTPLARRSQLELDLQKQYGVYLERFRNLDYLEHELDSLNKAEEEKVRVCDLEVDVYFRA